MGPSWTQLGPMWNAAWAIIVTCVLCRFVGLGPKKWRPLGPARGSGIKPLQGPRRCQAKQINTITLLEAGGWTCLVAVHRELQYSSFRHHIYVHGFHLSFPFKLYVCSPIQKLFKLCIYANLVFHGRFNFNCVLSLQIHKFMRTKNID